MMDSRPTLIVTRVAEEAQAWVEALQRAGHGTTPVRAEALPLIEIAPVPDAQPLQEAWRRITSFAAVMFVSASAARHFLAHAPHAPHAPHALRARLWATGPGTQRALLEAGCDPALVDAPAANANQFDSEALWGKVAQQVATGSRVLIVRGADAQGHITGRDWLATQLEAAGADVEQVAAYVRRGPAFTEPQRARMAAAAADGSIWLFSSSEAVGYLRAALPAQDWSAARAVATHPRIAQAARDAGFARVLTCRGTVEEILASIESFA
jgi:uroporphyrinogen-III synthase